VFSVVSSSSAHDWVSWRGPEQNGVSREKDLPDRWDPKGGPNSNLIWKKPFGGRSAPVVMNGKVYIINKAGEGQNEQERVMCFNADTGEVIWQSRFNVFFTDIVSARLGWTNLAGDPETGNIYAHGVQGLFYCFNGKTGEVIWSHSLTEEYGRVSGYGGRVNSPTVDGNLVIIGMLNASWGDQARGANRLLAMDKRTGKPVWWSTLPGAIRGTYYSSPVVTVVNGQRLLITGGSGGGIHALKVRTGEVVWSFPVGAKAINSSPVVKGNLVYIAYGEELMGSTDQGRVVCLDASKVQDKKPAVVWDKQGMTIKFASPILHESRLYVCNEGGRMYCLDAKNGKRLWFVKYGRSGAGSPVWADGKIYVAEAGDHFAILKPEAKRCRKLQIVKLVSRDPNTLVEINGSPSVANGRIYFTSSEEIYCIGNKTPAKASPIPPEPKEPKADPNAKPAHLQVFPADVVLAPGQSEAFKVRAFDAAGRFLKEVKAEWSLPKPPLPPKAKVGPPALQGQIEGGRLTVAKQVPFQAGAVLAKVGKLAGRARVRVVPPLPFQMDFNKLKLGAVPGGWVNCAGKFKAEKLKNKMVLMKTNTSPNPLLARGRTFMAMPTVTNYTIQTDLMGTRVGDDLPDMGVCANRYTLFLDGNKQRLRLTSWSALPRVDEYIPFPWKAKAWYRIKFTVSVTKGKASLRGKVWPRGEKEPKKWTIEVEDSTPNPEGSPGLYAYSTNVLDDQPGTAVYFAKVSVTPNRK
jgi:outer membrane protein assembly factor BamB